ncbi:TPA: tail fiber domain-containing protein [Citrobacter koseri]|nr:tail fiber domain-containing protein [Citrobacter koseri]HBL7005167.1 tail fiber domain-containing protein [Citrobacter koseri]
MSKTIIDATFLDLQSESMDYDIIQAKSDISRLYNKSGISDIKDITILGLNSSSVTMADIFSRMPRNSMLQMAIIQNNYPNLDIPISPSGSRMSGTLNVYGNSIAEDRGAAEYYNEFGKWRRYFNKAYSEGHALRDSGWLWISCPGAQLTIDAAASTALNGLLSNLRTPCDYFVAGGVLSTFTDSPYSVAGVPNVASHIKVERALQDRGVIISVRANNNNQVGWRRFISSAGVVGGWVQEFVSGTPLSTTGTIDFAGGTVSGHLSPNTAASKNLGGASLPFNNIYVQNAPVVISDREAKMKTSSIPDDVLDAWATVEYSQWKLKAAVAEKGEGSARFHVGIIAQEIKEKFELAGLDATQYGILIHEKWDAQDAVNYQPAQFDDDGSLTAPEILPQPSRNAGEIWMVRMEECLALEAALMRRELEKLNQH